MIKMYEFSSSRDIWQGERYVICVICTLLSTLFSWLINFNFAFVLAHKSLLYMQYALNNVFRFRCLDSHKTLPYATLPWTQSSSIRSFLTEKFQSHQFIKHVIPSIFHFFVYPTYTHRRVCAQKKVMAWNVDDYYHFPKNFALEFIHSLWSGRYVSFFLFLSLSHSLYLLPVF